MGHAFQATAILIYHTHEQQFVISDSIEISHPIRAMLQAFPRTVVESAGGLQELSSPNLLRKVGEQLPLLRVAETSAHPENGRFDKAAQNFTGKLTVIRGLRPRSAKLSPQVPSSQAPGIGQIAKRCSRRSPSNICTPEQLVRLSTCRL